MKKQPETCEKFELNLELTPEQMEELRPIIEKGGKVAFTGGNLKGRQISISYVACNRPFIAVKDQGT